jgi:site-specific DNA recombinase
VLQAVVERKPWSRTWSDGGPWKQPDSRAEATEALRGLVDAIVLSPDESGKALQIDLRGNLAAMLGATVQTERSSESDDLSLQVSLVAGAGFEPATFGL